MRRAPFLHIVILIGFIFNALGPLPVYAQEGLALPTPGVMVHLSPSFNPPVLKGLKVYTDNPFKFDFILDQGDDHVIASEAPRVIASEAKQSLTDGHPEAKPHVSLRAKRSNPSNTKKIASSPRPSVGTPRNDTELRAEAQRLIKYFLAAITVPDNDLWVNLSPYEKDRIIPDAFGKTEMGRDLLAQDYLLKQVTASLIYPEERIGKEFWQKVYAQAQARFGTTNIPVNTFNKVWIVPEKAVVYEHASFPPGGEGKGGGQAVAYVVESKLKVMLEEDYLALEKALPTRGHVPSVMASPENSSVIASEAPRVIASEAKQSFKHAKKIASSLRPSVGTPRNDMSALASQIIRDIVLPQLQKEINEGKNFAPLRQVYNSLILAAWYKKKIKDSILNKIYADQNKVAGVGYVNSVIASEAPRVIASERSERSNPSNTKKIASSPRPSVGTPRNDTEIIYNQYLQAFKKGVFNYIKEDSSVILSPVSPVILKPEGLKDPNVSNAIPRKYFSGGMSLGLTSLNMAQGMTIVHQADIGAADTGMIVTAQVIASAGNPAMSTLEIAGKIIHQLSGAIMPLKGRQIRLTAAQGGSFFGQFQIDFNVLDEHGIGLLKRALGFIVRTEGEKIYVEWDQISELLSDPDPHLSDLKHEMIKKLLSALPPGVIFSFPLFSLPREQRETLFLAAPVGVIFSFPVLDADDLIGHVFSNFEFTVVGLARRSNGKRVRPWSRALKESPMGELLIRSGFSDLHLREGIGQARDREALRRRLDGSFQKEMIMTAVKVRDAAMVESPEREKVVQEIIERMAQAKGGTMGDAGPLRDKVRLHRVRREEVEQPLKLLLEQKISPQSLQAHLEGIIKMVAGSGEGINKRMRQEQGRASHVFIAGVNVSWWFELGQERLAQVRGLAGYFYPLRNDRDPKPRDAMAQELRDIEESLKQWIKEQIVGDGAKRSLDQFSNDWNTDDGPSLLPENIRHVFGNRLMLLAAFRTGEGRIDRLLDKIYAYKEADAYNWPALRRQLFFDAVDLFIAVEQLLDRQPSAQEDEVIKNIEKGTMALLSAFFVSEHAPGGDTYNGEVSTAPVDGDPQKIKVVLAFPNPKTLAGSDQLERIQQYLNQWYKRQGMEAPKPLLTVRREYRDTGGELSSIRYEAQLPFFREASRRASIQVKYENIQEIRYAVISLSSRKTMYVALEESSSITSDGKKYYFAGSGGQGSIYVNPESREIVKIFNKMRSQPEKKHLDKLVEVVRQLRQKYQEEIIDMQEVVLCEDPQGQRDWGIRMPLIPGFHMNLGELLFDGFKDRIKEILGYIDFITDDSSDRHTSFEDTVKNNVVYNDQEGHLVSNDPVDMWIIMDRIEDQELSLQKVGERYAMAYEDQGGEDHWGNITEMRERLVYKILSDVKRDILAKRIRADQLEQESLKRFDQLWENLRVKDAVQYLNSTHKIKAVAQRWGKYLLSSEDSAMQTQSTALSAQNEPGIEEVMKESLKNRRVGLYVLRLAADSGALRLNIIQSSDQKIVGHLTFSVNNAFKRVDITATGFYSVESQGQGTATAILKAIREQLPIGWGVVLQGVVDYKTIYSMLEGISRQEAVKNLFEEEDLEKFEGLWARVQSDPELLKNSPEENLLARKLLRAYALKQPSVEASSTLTDLGANALFIRALRTAGYVNARVVVRDDDTVDIEASTGNPAQASDAAMMREKGGIDLTDGKMPLSVILSEANGRAKNDNGMFPQDDNGIQFDIDPAMIKQWQEAPGFVPGIINIKPVGNLRQFLGLENNASQDQTAML